MDFKKPITSDLVRSFNPEFKLENNFVSDTFVSEIERVPGSDASSLKAFNKKLAEANSKFEVSNINKKMSLKESEIALAKLEELKNRYIGAKDMILKIQERINKRVTGDGSNPELSYSLKVEKRGYLRRAIRKVFGKNTAEVTYSMYVEALKMKRLLEKESSDELMGD